MARVEQYRLLTGWHELDQASSARSPLSCASRSPGSSSNSPYGKRGGSTETPGGGGGAKPHGGSPGRSRQQPFLDDQESSAGRRGMFAAMDEAHSLEDLAAAAQGGFLVRTIFYSLLFGWQLFRAVMTAIEMGGWDTQSLLRFRAFVYTATMLPVVILAGRMTAAPVSDLVAWGAAVASGLRACMAVGEILLLTFGLTACVVPSLAWYLAILMLEFAILCASGELCALSAKLLESKARISQEIRKQKQFSSYYVNKDNE